MMLFGRDLSLPSTVVRGVPPQTPALPARLRYPVWLRDRLQHLHHAVRERVHAVTLRRKERYDAHWTGPHIIMRMLSDVVAQLRCILRRRRG